MFSLPFYSKSTIIINKSEQDIFQILGDFKTWKNWSPWTCQEENGTYEVKGPPHTTGHHHYYWKGQIIGEGQMTLIEIEENKRLKFEIDFIKPWKSQSQTQFILKNHPQGTEVTWTMNGTIPIFLFFLKKMISASVNCDYARGLSMLKDLLETGAVHCKIKHYGKISKEPFYFFGKKRKCLISDMPKLMDEDFQNLGELEQNGIIEKPIGFASFYHKFDLVNEDCEYTSVYLYDKDINCNKDDFESGYIPKHSAIQVVHKGPYKNLGNAWMAAIGYQRSSKEGLNKKIPMYEIYLNDPKSTKEEDIETEINIPIK